MNLEKLDRKDFRLIAICAVVAAVSLYVGVRYFFKAFPEAQIDFKTTKQTSLPIAQDFLAGLDLPTTGYRHAAIFDFDDDAKTFLEREVGAEESGRLLDGPIRLWRWRHRWYRPLQKEELQVEVTTRGEVAAFHHLLAEEAKGAGLPAEEARRIAETFLTNVIKRRLTDLTFIEGAVLKRPNRTDHEFTWKVGGADVHGADYRIRVAVAGDKASGYNEYLNLPDAWKEGYKRLRSKNETAGVVDSALLLATVVVMLAMLVARIRRGDVKWGAAGVLGAITFLFTSLSALNTIPIDLFHYDTTTTLPAFLLQALLQTVLQGLSVGAIIFLIAAAAEPLYRERFPRMQSLSALVRPRALRTRETFIAIVVGLALTFFFFAYENVFYMVAHGLGAWSPRDVKYSDLLSTTFPWVFVLFVGWLPAISEEFISRMFSIPFFERAGRFLRLPPALRLPLALFVASVIWGFGHAAYPNQPWWIRGLEVGLAGIVFGLVFMRWGIVAVVTCHFSVDALYTAFVMIRSGNPYYVITGALCSGVFAILLVVAGVLYAARGGFEPAATNESEGVAPPPPPAPPRPSAPDAASVYRRQPALMVAIGLVAAAALAGLALVPIDAFGDWVDFKTTKQRAREAGESFLRSRGFNVSSYKSAVAAFDRTDPPAAAYLLEKGGLAVAKTAYETRVPTPLWRPRFYIPEQKEEYTVSVDPRSGSVVGFTRTLPDDAPGGRLDKAQALALAEEFARTMGQNGRGGELKEQTEKDEKARRDHTLVWEYPIEGGGEARARYEIVVQGSAIGSWTRGVKIPEEWDRARTGWTAGFVLRLAYLVIFAGTLVALPVILFVGLVRSGEVPWKLGFLVGGVCGVAAALSVVLNLEKTWAIGYQTSMPEAFFTISLLVVVVGAGVVYFLGGVLVVGLAAALHPAAAAAFSARNRRAYARDALLAGLVAAGLAFAIPVLGELIGTAIPSGRLIGGAGGPELIDTAVPYLAILLKIVVRAIFYPALGAIGVGVLAHFFRSTAARAVLALLAAFAMVPLWARGTGEILTGTIQGLVTVAAVALLVRFFLRDNPLAWIWSAWFAFGVKSSAALIAQSAPMYRNGGLIALAVVLAPGLILVLDALAGTKRKT